MEVQKLVSDRRISVFIKKKKPLLQKFFSMFILYGLSEIPWRDMELPVETAGKRRGIVEAAGEGDLCDGVAGGTEHFHGHAEPVVEKVLLG